VPSRIELAEAPAFLDPDAKPANSRIFLDAIPTLRIFPALATWSEVEAAVNAELSQAFYGQLSLDEALRAVEMRSAEFLR
ncbi:MAG: sugar ABC transporter substrate-binding protein, partial [Caldilinea sp.]